MKKINPQTKGWNFSIATVMNLPKEEINEYNTDDEDIEFAIEEAAQGRI